jgi:hypothetical protein
MNSSGESMDQRRAHLAAQIARQRGELDLAYRNLAKPIQYGENALHGFGFLRRNPWVLSVVPAVFSIGSTVLGLRKGKSPKPSRSQRQELERLERRPKTFVGHAAKWGGHGWRLFKLYRRLRHYLP